MKEDNPYHIGSCFTTFLPVDEGSECGEGNVE